MLDKVMVIAEAGVNHNGDIQKAMELIDLAASVGADFVKFQTFEVDSLADPNTPLAAYQKNADPSLSNQAELLKSLELTKSQFVELERHCKKRNIGFLSTAFDINSFKFLIEELEIPLVKIASGDLTYGPLLVEAAKSGKPLILSTGMADLEEIEDSLMLLEFTYAQDAGIVSREIQPTRQARKENWVKNGATHTSRLVSLMHCTSQYPAPNFALNIRAIPLMAEKFGLPVGYSDHSLGVGASCAAVALGARIIEKHFTLDKNLPGPDHAASLEPNEFSEFVRAIHDTSEALGFSQKHCQPIEESTKVVSRRSISAKTQIEKDNFISIEDVMFIRPSGKSSPMDIWDILAIPAVGNYNPGDQV